MTPNKLNCSVFRCDAVNLVEADERPLEKCLIQYVSLTRL